ncbi:MAG: MFS family permease [Candidatus Krumholzibacteriia bacterium]
MSETTIEDSLIGRKMVFGFTIGYWMLNIIEMFERLAYYSIRSVVAIYIMQADDPDGLHLTAADKGTIYFYWFVFQSLLPTFIGGLADRYGYKKMLFVSITLSVLGYIVMGTLHSYAGFLFGVIVLASGSAFFKPSMQGSLAHNLTKANSSMGWGIFYWVVNVGAAAAPIMANFVRADFGWSALFYVAAGVMSLNYLMLFTFRDFDSGADKAESLMTVLWRTLKNLSDLRLVIWLVIMGGFYLMMYALWDMQPNFVTDWNDSSDVAGWIQSVNILPDSWVTNSGGGARVPQELLLNLNAVLIVLFVIPISYLVRKMRTLEAIVVGMVLATAGVLVAGLTSTGIVLLLGIGCFSLGEMLTGPKKSEYLGLIAPPAKKGLYLGYVNLPVGLGGSIGAKMQGYLYGNFGEKAVLAQKWLATRAEEAGGAVWDGKVDSLEALTGVARSEAFIKMQEVSGLDANGATDLLWTTYNPGLTVWLPFAVIGIVSTIGLVVFARMARRWQDMDA